MCPALIPHNFFISFCICSLLMASSPVVIVSVVLVWLCVCEARVCQRKDLVAGIAPKDCVELHLRCIQLRLVL